MLLPKIDELPMKCFRLTLPENVYDIFIPDTTDVSSCVNITDQNGDQVPFQEWDNILLWIKNII
jgi:hypothetical protein